MPAHQGILDGNIKLEATLYPKQNCAVSIEATQSLEPHILAVELRAKKLQIT